MTYQAILDRWLAQAGDDPDLITELNEVKDDPDAVADRFYRALEALTAGAKALMKPM